MEGASAEVVTGGESQPSSAGTTEPVEQDAVRVEDAEDADLDAFLAEGDKTETTTQPTKPAEKPADKKLEKPTSEKKPDTGPEFIKAAELPKDPPSREDYDRLVKTVEQQELFLKRRSTEIGGLRTELRETKSKLAALVTEEKWGEDPRTAHRAQSQIDEIDKNLAALDQEEQQVQHEVVSKKIVAKHVKPEELDDDAVVEMLTEDGMNPDFLKEFKANPHSAVSPETLVHLYKRAHVEKVLKKLVPGLKRLLAENIELKKNGANKASGEKVLDRVQKELKRPAHMTASQGTTTSTTDDASAADVTQIDDAALDELLQRASRN